VPARQPQQGEPLFSFRTSNHWQVDADVIERPGYGFEARFFIDGSFSRSRRFETREGAVQWAEAERSAILRGVDDIDTT
jgi:hypothetical protein